MRSAVPPAGIGRSLKATAEGAGLGSRRFLVQRGARDYAGCLPFALAVVATMSVAAAVVGGLVIGSEGPAVAVFVPAIALFVLSEFLRRRETPEPLAPLDERHVQGRLWVAVHEKGVAVWSTDRLDSFAVRWPELAGARHHEGTRPEADWLDLEILGRSVNSLIHVPYRVEEGGDVAAYVLDRLRALG